MRVAFDIPCVPVPQSRPRFTRQGHAYDTQKSKAYKALVRAEAANRMRGRKPFDGAVVASLKFYLPIPKSWSKKKREAALDRRILPIGRVGDTDNYVKAVLDACNGVIYDDDSQVIHITAEKWYGDVAGVVAEFTCFSK